MLHPQISGHEDHPLRQVLILVGVFLVTEESIEHVALEVFQQVDLVVQFPRICVDGVVCPNALYKVALR